MSPDEKEPFNAVAREEQHLREEAARQPWGTKDGPGKVTQQPSLPPAAMKSISRQKSVQSYSNFRESSWWDEMGCGLSCADGILRLDLIDTERTKDDLSERFRAFLRNAGELPEQLSWEERDDVHHTTCQIGQCAKGTWARSATQFVTNFARLLQDGALVSGIHPVF